MSEAPEISFIYVMDTRESASWHQPITHLRQWQRRRVLEKVNVEAEVQGFGRYAIYDIREDLQSEGRVGEKTEP